ncbi:MAG: TetR/AcrR family transcriptional regulator, partial [Bacteroidota bacterium]
MRTKEKILATALALFNEKGVESVTTRQIAIAMNISQGNLCYHFPKKEAIIMALYQQLVQKFDELYLKFSINKEGTDELLSIQNFLAVIRITNQYFVDYKFLMLNFAQIMRQHPSVKKHYQQLTNQRIQQTLALFTAFQRADLLRTEQYSGQYLHIIEQFMILNNFWLSHAEILFQGEESEKIAHFNQLVGSFIFPFL